MITISSRLTYSLERLRGNTRHSARDSDTDLTAFHANMAIQEQHFRHPERHASSRTLRDSYATSHATPQIRPLGTLQRKWSDD
jgi:hypothetical protein